MDYIEGFVAAVPIKNKAAYIKHAEEAAVLFKKYGAKRLIECWGNDVPNGKLTSFLKAVQCKDDETVVFSWAVWPSKTVRDAGMDKMMADDAMQNMENSMPFDGKRLIYGGFQMVVDK